MNTPFHPGQLVMVNIAGKALDAATAAFLREHRFRAICLFRWNLGTPDEVRRLTADLREVMGEHALIGIDQEGGSVVRSTFLPQAPAAMALGAANDEAMTEEVGAAVARGLRSLGINWNFAPVLDVNNNPANPVIAERSFGEDPVQVARLAGAWMRGSLREGVACCVKHFPGHGDTHVDSHRDLPTVNKPLEQLEAFEFAPFKMAAPQAPAMMTAHIVYPSIDPDNPATMSPAILEKLLRKDWQYRGVIITDGMDMHAIAGRYGVGNAAVRALTAGADMVMALGTTETQNETLDAIAKALAEGALSDEQVQERLDRLSALARAYPCKPRSYKEDAADREIMAEGWRRSLTARGNPQRPAKGSKVRLIARQDVVSDGVSEAGVPASTVATTLGKLFDVELITFADADTFDWSSLPQDGAFTILASTSRLRYGDNARNTWKPDLHLALWNPYQALDINAPALMTYGFAAPALDAVNGWLSGALEAQGRCPVPGFA